ncbi:MAG: stability/partitioning determinant [Oxalobacteraceae bacterium]|nr:MAG: stability/partitioning determinant [Oxalobacteraceae bacterium]
MTERANPFGDLGDFTPAPAKPKPDPAVIDQVAEDNGFPSRKPFVPPLSQAPAPLTPVEESPVRKQRRYTTGRNKQINIKATDQTIERLYRLADARKVPLGELLKQALDALEDSDT